MFEQLYASSWQFPWGILLLQLLALVWIAQRYRASGPSWIGRAALLLQLLIIADDLSKVPALAGLGTAFGVGFVMLGDLRFLVLVERWGHRDPPAIARWIGLPLVLCFVVPTLSWLFVQRAAGIAELRVLFVVHELMFAMLALGWLVATRARRDLPEGHRRFVERLCTFEVAQYGLWVAADLVIMFGHDVGFALRAIPNILYYVAFVPFVVLSAPRET